MNNLLIIVSSAKLYTFLREKKKKKAVYEL